jgi:hypothetical protein
MHMEKGGEGSRKSTKSWNEGALHVSYTGGGSLPTGLLPALTLRIELWMSMANRGVLFGLILVGKFGLRGIAAKSGL